MSYSFSVRAASKELAMADVEKALQGVIDQQPVHAVDQAQAKSAAFAFIDLIADDASKDVYVSVAGSVWQTESGLRSASFNVNASLMDKEKA